MATNQKIETVKQLKENLEKSKLTILTDYRGLKTSDLDQLRGELLQTNSEYNVTKNTLLLRALKETHKDSLVNQEALNGPTATLFAYGDEITPVKSLLKLIKNLGLPVIKSGMLGTQAITPSQVQELGKLPAREVLLGKLVGGLSSPLYGIVNVLSGNLRKLVYVLNAVREVKK